MPSRTKQTPTNFSNLVGASFKWCKVRCQTFIDVNIKKELSWVIIIIFIWFDERKRTQSRKNYNHTWKINDLTRKGQAGSKCKLRISK